MKALNIVCFAASAVALTATLAFELKIRKIHKQREKDVSDYLEELRFNEAKDVTAETVVTA